MILPTFCDEGNPVAGCGAGAQEFHFLVTDANRARVSDKLERYIAKYADNNLTPCKPMSLISQNNIAGPVGRGLLTR